MSKNKKVIQRIIIVVVIIIAILALVILNQNYNSKNTNTTDNNINLYDNLSIDSSQLNIFYLNVGQADSTFITLNGVNMLIDAGNDSDGYYITNFLKAQNIDRIDYFVLTHCDEDHIGGAYKVLENFQIGTLYMPKKYTNTNVYRKLINTIQKNNIVVNQNLLPNEERYNIGQAEWKILSVDAGNSENVSSIVIELDYVNTKYLFMGDASNTVENSINVSNVNVIKVSHHGSDTATSQSFIDKIKPKYAIISVGKDNQYGLPKQEIIDRLIENGTKVYRTDQDGTIWLTSNGADINIALLEYNLDGAGRKISMIFYKRKYLIAFSYLY